MLLGILLCTLINYVDCYCTGVGANPGFTAGPQVHQVQHVSFMTLVTL